MPIAEPELRQWVCHMVEGKASRRQFMRMMLELGLSAPSHRESACHLHTCCSTGGSGRAVGVYPNQTRRRGQVAPVVVAGPDDCQRALVDRYEGQRCLTGGPRALSRI